MSAFALFRSCTTSLSSRTLAREAATLRSGRCIANTRRFYSQKDESAESPNAVEEEAAETEGDGVKEGASEGAQELTALKTKLEETEAKVTDLIVRILLLPIILQSAHQFTRANYGIQRPSTRTSTGTPRANWNKAKLLLLTVSLPTFSKQSTSFH